MFGRCIGWLKRKVSGFSGSHAAKRRSSSRGPVRFSEDSGEAERCFRREAERHSRMNPNTSGA